MEAGICCDIELLVGFHRSIGALCYSVPEAITAWRWAPLAMLAALLVLLGVV